MSTTTPTPIPAHPQPGFYETTVAQGGSPDVLLYPVDHEKVEQILARPRWSLEMANALVNGKMAAEKKASTRRPKKSS